MFDVKHRGRVWEIVFLDTDSALHEEDRARICFSALELYHNGRAARRITGEEFEGLMWTDGKCYHIGSFEGRKFEARIETNHGKRNVNVLVAEKMNNRLN